MKTIGLIGGMSWESSLEYYRIMNETVKKELGGQHSCQSLMYSVEFGEIVKLQHEGKWDELTKLMVKIGQSLKKGGADLIVICTNTMHLMAEDIAINTKLPLIHIVDAVGEKIVKKKLTKVALLGTKFTMEKDFYKKKLMEKYNIDVIIPNEKDREDVHNIIYNELIQGTIKESSKTKYKKIIEKLSSAGAEGVILGCTEIPLLIQQKDSVIPVFDTTKIHAKKAVEFALK